MTTAPFAEHRDLAGRVASVAAAYCLEAIGPQPPRFDPEDFAARYRENFGSAPELDSLAGTT